MQSYPSKKLLLFVHILGRINANCILGRMSTVENNLSTSEYKFTFRETGSSLTSERHFSATTPAVAKEMFEFACRKDEVLVDDVDFSVWNRWADRWDEVSSLEEVSGSH